VVLILVKKENKIKNIFSYILTFKSKMLLCKQILIKNKFKKVKIIVPKGVLYYERKCSCHHEGAGSLQRRRLPL
jgi:hypothetical protein